MPRPKDPNAVRQRHPRTGKELSPRQTELLKLARAGHVVRVSNGLMPTHCVLCAGVRFAMVTFVGLRSCFGKPVPHRRHRGWIFAHDYTITEECAA